MHAGSIQTTQHKGFSPFLLLYGRPVRGLGMILKELWTNEVNIPEVKTSYDPTVISGLNYIDLTSKFYIG